MQEHEALMILQIIEGAWDKPFGDRLDDEGKSITTSVWTRMLMDMPFKATEQAVLRLARTHKFRPSIAEIRQAVLEYVDPFPSTEEAYMEARRAAQTFCPYSGGIRHEWSHPLIEQAARVVGIETMAYSEEPTIIAAQFRRAYESIRERAEIRRQQESMQLPGRDAAALTNGEADMARVIVDRWRE